jgi:hypothetical protein
MLALPAAMAYFSRQPFRLSSNPAHMSGRFAETFPTGGVTLFQQKPRFLETSREAHDCYPASMSRETKRNLCS